MAKKKVVKKSTTTRYEFAEGKYVLGDVDELFDEKLTKKMKTAIKKLAKTNHGTNEKLGIHWFKVGERVIDLIEYQNKILTANKGLVMCKDDIIKSGKLRFCKRFTAKDKFYVNADYTNDDYCLYFYYYDTPSPFMMWQGETLIG